MGIIIISLVMLLFVAIIFDFKSIQKKERERMDDKENFGESDSSKLDFIE